MPVYLGPAGHLQKLPGPRTGVQATLVRQGAVLELAGGGFVVEQTGKARQYTLTWNRLTQSDLTILEGLYVGLWGPGPFCLLDPMRINLLPANVATGTDVDRATTLFAATVGTLASSTTVADNGLHSLKWTPGELSAAESVTAPSTPVDNAVPVVADLSYVVSMRARLGSGSDAASGRAELRWYDGDGSAVSTSQGTSTALSSSSWTTLTAADTPPSTAVYVGVAFQAPTTTGSPVFHVDSLQLALGSVAPDWAPGTGVPRVGIDQMSDSYPQNKRHDVTMTLVEG